MPPVTLHSVFEKPVGPTAEQVTAARQALGSNRLNSLSKNKGRRGVGGGLQVLETKEECFITRAFVGVRRDFGFVVSQLDT